MDCKSQEAEFKLGTVAAFQGLDGGCNSRALGVETEVKKFNRYLIIL